MKKLKKYKFDVTPSVEDKRDFLVGSIYSSPIVLPDTIDFRPDLPEVRDQGAQGSCSAQTAACMKEWQEYIDVEFKEHMSPQFIYNQRENTDYGMTPRDTMKILSNIGIVPEKDYPYGTKAKISEALILKAKSYTIVGYARIYTLNELKKALVGNGPCYIAFPVYSFEPQFWKQDPSTDSYYGGHAVSVVGYTKDSFIIRNSWGIDWADKGYTYYPFEQWGAHWEAWTTIDADSNPTPIPEPSPTPIPTPEPTPTPIPIPDKKKELEDDLKKKANERLTWFQKIFFCLNKKIV